MFKLLFQVTFPKLLFHVTCSSYVKKSSVVVKIPFVKVTLAMKKNIYLWLRNDRRKQSERRGRRRREEGEGEGEGRRRRRKN